MNQNDPTPAPVPTPRTDADDRTYPLPEYAQRIVFEGCDSVVVDPEAYEALYEHARTLERELIDAKELLKYCAKEKSQLFADLTATKAALAEAQKDKERLSNLIMAVENTLNNIPGCHDGHFIVMHYDGEGRELGPEYLDAFAVVGHIDQALRDALDAARAEREGGGHA